METRSKDDTAEEPCSWITHARFSRSVCHRFDASSVSSMEKTGKRSTGDAVGGELSTWLMRTRFSRSVCYRLDSSNMPDLYLSFMDEHHASKRHQVKNHEMILGPGSTSNTSQRELICHDIQPQKSSENRFLVSSSESSSTASVSSHPCTEMPYKFISLKLRSMPWFLRSKSLPSVKKRVDHHDEGQFSIATNYGRERNGEAPACDSSWSTYFANSEDEYAVEEAEDWMVDLSELYLGCRFASGTYSRLYIGKYKGSSVAVKVLKLPDDDIDISRKLDRQFRSEVVVLSRLHHPNIVKFIGACRKPPVACIITEYLALGSLRNYLHNQPPYSLPMKLVVDMALDIAHGMEYLHSEGVIHRDLKSQNLVVGEDLHVKITDFGVACFESEANNTTEHVGTYRWMAPEMISHKQYSTKVDVFSFGMVLWELLSGRIPFEELLPVQAAFAVVNKHARPPLPLNCPSPLAELIHRCWATNASRRPSFSKIVLVLEEMKETLQSQSCVSRHKVHDARPVLHHFLRWCAFRKIL